MQDDSRCQTADEIIVAFAEIGASAEALCRTDGDSDAPRDSVTEEIAQWLRAYLSTMAPAKREAAFAIFSQTVSDAPLVERDLGSLPFSIAWQSGARPTCPCESADDCELMFQEVGFGPEDDADPSARAQPENIAKCPLHQPIELSLVGVAPTKMFRRWWRRVKGRPARGLLRARDGRGRQVPLDLVSGDTIPQMMREAKRALHNRRRAASGLLMEAQVLLLPGWAAASRPKDRTKA